MSGHHCAGSRDQHHLRVRQRGGSERAEDALAAEDDGQDGQEGGQGEDSLHAGLRQVIQLSALDSVRRNPLPGPFPC